MLITLHTQAQQSLDHKVTKPTALSKITNRQDGLIISLTSDGWLELPAGIETHPFSSRGFSFYFMGEKMNSGGVIGLGYGIGMSSQNFSSNGYFDDVSDPAKTRMHAINDSIDYSINKLSLNYLDLALEIRLRTHANENHKRFKLSLGAKAGWMFQDHEKYKDDHNKNKSYNLEHLNAFQYGLTGRIGYGKWALNGYYALTGIFEKVKGPDLVPFSVGISFTP